MDHLYTIMLIMLGILAFIDISVGVSNDAVNFMNSAIGSKAISFKTTLIVASLGILCGTFFSNGMMEIAQNGIFHPEYFTFHEIMIVFLAVMISDILLLDVFNSLGLPTSTTVSIVFELLGASVSLGFIKIINNNTELNTIYQYINTEKILLIACGILVSIILAFLIGSCTQYISRLIFTFNYTNRLKKLGFLFGGFALTFISYFLLIKGEQSSSLLSKKTLLWITEHPLILILLMFIFWAVTSQILVKLFNTNILKLIIVVGTFSLALTFAGNDLVNFIGVPLAGYEAYNIFLLADNGVDAQHFLMADLKEVSTAPLYLLVLAGLFMVFVLSTSKKAKVVVKTELNLSRQGYGTEKFGVNALAKIFVRIFLRISRFINSLLPSAINLKLDNIFKEKKNFQVRFDYNNEEQSFDMIRASVNLTVASILIAFGTFMKFPLSTTYVTFMVGMGTSFADKAWDRDSAVYRVSGVFNVILGWFGTAFLAFFGAVFISIILYFGEIYALICTIVLLAISLYRSNLSNKSKEENKTEQLLSKVDLLTLQEVMNESSNQMSYFISKSVNIYTLTIKELGKQNLKELKKNNKQIKKIEKKHHLLRDNIYYFIKNLDETSVEASKFYIRSLNYSQGILLSLSKITQNSYSHIDNNHKQLTFNQIKDLKKIEVQLELLLNKTKKVFKKCDFQKIDEIIADEQGLSDNIKESIQRQINRIRTIETSPNNSKLYFNILLETEDLVYSLMKLLRLFKDFDDLNQLDLPK